MVVRIVRMHFKSENVDLFLEIFHGNKGLIRKVKGCTHLELLKDVNNRLIYSTISYWEQAEDLENYRQSELFKNVWSRVKPLFSAPTEAFSLEKVTEL
jgi:(4S)-4-hydroxy-5-phosphonooxypentane-2,3-dione isomerase